MEKEWKGVFFYNEKKKQWFHLEEAYQVNNKGEVKSLPRNGTVKAERIMKPRIQDNGYLAVNLKYKGVSNNYHIARLVAFAFQEICGEWFEGAQVNHKNENKFDNRAENLEWVISKDNVNYGTRNKRTGEKNKKSQPSKPVEQYTKEGEFIAWYPSAHEAERQTGVPKSNIANCCKGKPKHATRGSFIWKYAQLEDK